MPQFQIIFRTYETSIKINDKYDRSPHENGQIYVKS